MSKPGIFPKRSAQPKKAGLSEGCARLSMTLAKGRTLSAVPQPVGTIL